MKDKKKRSRPSSDYSRSENDEDLSQNESPFRSELNSRTMQSIASPQSVINGNSTLNNTALRAIS